MTRLPDISISGPMRSGKTTCQDYLVRTYGYVPMSFAAALKLEVARGVGVFVEAIEKEPLKSEVRGILQYWGTEFRRKQNPNHWVEQLAKRYTSFRSVYPDRPVVIADTRFRNELEYLKSEGFTTVKLEMSDEDVYRYYAYTDGRIPGWDEFQKMIMHPSERDLDKEQFDITLSSVRGKVKDLLKKLDTNLMIKYDGGEAACDT